jgi:Glycosyl hydrolase family 26
MVVKMSRRPLSAKGRKDKIVGIYVGNTPSAIAPFETWLGVPVGGILAYGNHNSNWTEFDNSIPYNIDLWTPANRRVLWSIPLIVAQATLELASSGSYNSNYRRAAETISPFRPHDEELHIRTGWEFNGDWFPWKAEGKAAAFIGAYRQFVQTFRSVSSRFKFEWTPNIGRTMNPADAYPGDDVVDIIGMDAYYDLAYDSPNGSTAFANKMTQNWGLQWHKDFAASRGKRMAYSEWGINSDSPDYVQLMHDWCLTTDVVQQTYWNSDAAFRGSLYHYPNAEARYKTLFSRW